MPLNVSFHQLSKNYRYSIYKHTCKLENMEPEMIFAYISLNMDTHLLYMDINPPEIPYYDKIPIPQADSSSYN